MPLTTLLIINRVRPHYSDSKWQHVQLVLNAAQEIKLKLLSPILKAIIYYHDVLKKRLGNNGHLLAGAKYAEKDLKGSYSPAEIKLIANAIRLHSPDYRKTFKHFQHSSPEALLLALADDSNNLRRDPDLMAMYSVWYQKNNPKLFPDVDSGYDRHRYYFGPLHAHPDLKYYKDRWAQYAKSGIDNIDNYPKEKFQILWDLINKDTKLPDLDILTKPMKKSAALSLFELKQLSDPYYTDDRKQHIQLVLARAKKLKRGKLTPLELAAIYLHDAAKRDMGALNHAANSAILALKLLKRDYQADKLKRIITAIKLHGPAWNRPDAKYTYPESLLLGVSDDWNIMDKGPSTLMLKAIKYNMKNGTNWDDALWMKQLLIRTNMDTRLPKMKVYDKQWQKHVAPLRLYVNNFNLNEMHRLMDKYKGQ